MFSDHEVTRYTLMQHSPSISDEEKFWERTSEDKDSRVWGVYLDESPLIGITSIRIDIPNHMGSTGFMLYDKSFWRKGIASTSHLARTHYAVEFLDLKSITSGVISPNTGSRKALQSVGYFITGYKLGQLYRNGVYRHHVDLQWIRPGYENLILADGIPEELSSRAKEAILTAEKALQRAKVEVKF
ncbi:GNAT family N-acetyltransferase [Candidatus Dojkabacteria bacterium]|nr:GNAT family N-acetyltransferase [Candidatus Dojkabacteria bacterium]